MRPASRRRHGANVSAFLPYWIPTSAHCASAGRPGAKRFYCSCVVAQGRKAWRRWPSRKAGGVGATHLRPLLGVRAPGADYAKAHGLVWVDDESNQDTRYRRNALRQQVMPLLAAHFPGAAATLARAAALQADAAELLDNLAQLDAATAVAGDRLDCAALAGLSRPRARNLLRYFIERHGQPMPCARQLNEALHQLLDARHDARVCVRLGQREVWRFRGGAYLAAVAPTPPLRCAGRRETTAGVPSAGGERAHGCRTGRWLEARHAGGGGGRARSAPGR